MRGRSIAKLAAVAAIVAMVAAACGKSTKAPTTTTPKGLVKGGTLNLGLASDVSAAFDPQKEYYEVSWAFFWCCLTRELYGYKQVPGPAGEVPIPDLATGPPTVSSSGLVYTIHIRPGIHYSPPLQNETVTAQDFVRAFMREANPQTSAGGYPFYYSVIKGFDSATKADGKSATTFAPVSGVKALNPTTLQITLTAPTGDFLFRLTMPATAPIAPLPNKPSAPMGVATGHPSNYGRFLPSLGPYMFAGENTLNFSLPPSKQGNGASGYVPGRSITLVRNPSWKPSLDPIRKAAYPDKIVTIIDTNTTDLANKVQAGTVDVMWAHVPTNVVQSYSTTPSLRPYLRSDPLNAVDYISLNLAVPPFDDIHVRKAVNYITDKTGLIRLAGGPLFGVPATHIIPNPMLHNVLASYNPYASPGEAGDLAAAKKEMMASKYDTLHNGMCDAPACKNVLTVVDESAPDPAEATLLNSDFSKIGITLAIRTEQRTTMYSDCDNPSKHIAVCPSVGWVQDYADPYTFMNPLFTSGALYPGCCNYSLLGATPSQLKGWGYKVTSVPSVNARLNACEPLSGTARVTCYANADKYLMSNVVPWIPWIFANNVELLSKRVVPSSYVYNAAIGLNELNLTALVNGGK